MSGIWAAVEGTAKTVLFFFYFSLEYYCKFSPDATAIESLGEELFHLCKHSVLNVLAFGRL